MPDEKLQSVQLFAYIGEDEHGGGQIGLKQAQVPAGLIPIVAVDEAKVNRQHIMAQLQHHANHFGKTIYLCRFKFDGIIAELAPQKQEPPPPRPHLWLGVGFHRASGGIIGLWADTDRELARLKSIGMAAAGLPIGPTHVTLEPDEIEMFDFAAEPARLKYQLELWLVGEGLEKSVAGPLMSGLSATLAQRMANILPPEMLDLKKQIVDLLEARA